ncbi:MAG: PQQ-binding-like beta-propeller repeat protein, partial [Halieaceae bacterium]|nr:PQQ-binding-like beta-propeller repeat protein [Halieaceae bacterium]
MMWPITQKLLVVILLLGLSGCSTISGWFSSDDDDATAPAALIDIDETVAIDKLWSEGVGDGQGSGFYRIRSTIDGDTIYIASAEGEVMAIDRGNGDVLWDVELDSSLSGGVGVWEEGLFIGSSEGVVIKLDAATGLKLWATPLRGEILSPPQSNGRVVVAQTYDG